MFTLAAAGTLAASLLPASPAPFKLDDFVGRHLEAMGGAARLRALKALRHTGTVKLIGSDGTTEGTFLIEAKRPDKMRMEMSFEDWRTLQVFDGKAGWSRDESGALRPMTPEELVDARADADFDDWLLDHARRGITVEDLGPARAGPAATRKLKVTFPGGAEHLYIDTTTYLEVRRDDVDAGGKPGDQTWTRGYTIVGGLRFETEVEFVYTPDRFTPDRVILRFDKTEIDPDIPDSRFAPPK